MSLHRLASSLLFALALGSCSTPAATGADACTPATCSAAGAKCRSIDDGCGATAECGACSAPLTCVEHACSGGAPRDAGPANRQDAGGPSKVDAGGAASSLWDQMKWDSDRWQ
ncbi:MAG: hypothetical protein QM765_34545 [Myxococcales bacterium]